MKVLKGQKVKVEGGRGKGNYVGIAYEDFDTEIAEWYPIITTQYVCGMTADWEEGEVMPCRNGIDKILEIVEEA